MEEESEFLAAMYRDADEAQKNNPVVKIVDGENYEEESVVDDLDVESHSDQEMADERVQSPEQKVIEKIQYQDDSIEFKERLMELVTKGQEESMQKRERDRTQRGLLEAAKNDEEMYSKSFLQQAQSTINTRLERPPVDPISPKEDDIQFMCLDIDYYSDKPPKHLVTEHENREVSIIRMFGVNSKGNSLVVHVFNFKPYFYIQVPVTMHIEDAHMPALLELLNAKLQAAPGEIVTDVEIVMRKSIMHYSERPQKFIKVSTVLPKHVGQLRAHVEKGISFNQSTFWTTTFESNMPHSLRFMIDNDMVGMSWVDLLAGTYTVRPRSYKKTTNQLEIDIYDYTQMVFHKKCEGPYARVAPLRILSFDIECLSQKGKFPVSETDPVIQIANLCQMSDSDEPFVRNVFTLNTCAPIVGTQVFSFQSERDLLFAWREFVRLIDPDIITGYNIITFDFPYIIGRAHALGLQNFSQIGRVKNIITRVKETTFSSKMLGTRETKEMNIEGRIQFDMMQYIIREHKLRSYSLNSVSAKFLGEQKEDVQHSIIHDLQNADEYGRRRLAIYCIKDAYLPIRLMSKLDCIFNQSELARVCGVPLSYLFSRGQQIKVASQLYRKARALGFVIPTEKSSNEGKYEGAVVIEPTRGYYQDPVAVLDFASLYPSIMMAHNLCYSTLIMPYKLKDIEINKYEKTPNGDYFIKRSVMRGVLPQILEDLVQARKKVKQQLLTTDDSTEKRLLEGRSNALKVSANSVYGFTGAQVGQLPCLAISSSVTSYGRKMLEMTRTLVTEKFSVLNGYPADAHVLYGDTDSVMISFGVKSLEQTIELGKEAAEYVSSFFAEPICLVFEKCYSPFLLMQKKRYAGLLWQNPNNYEKIDCKGIETVRRDNCPLVKDVVNNVLKKILIERSYEEAINYCKSVISDLLQNRIDLSLLVISKGLGKKMKSEKKEENQYQVKAAHVELAERMRKRDAASAPSQGDRVAYVMIKGAKGARGFEKSEDPLFVLENNLPLDYNHYLEHQLKQPLIRLFEPILQSPESVLFVGEHTRTIYVPKVMNTGLGRYAVVKKSCLACKRVVEHGEALCGSCKPKEKQIYVERRLEQSRYEKNYADLWVQCQRCQGSLHQNILCQSRDCPIFYRRVKAAKNLKEAREVLQRFEW